MNEENVLEILKGISHPTRLAILRRIGELETTGSVTCSAVLDGLDISQSTFSHHITDLAQIGLVLAKPQGRCTMLSIDHEKWDEFQKRLGDAVFG